MADYLTADMVRPLVKAVCDLAYVLKAEGSSVAKSDAKPADDEPMDYEAIAELFYGLYGEDAIEKVEQILEKTGGGSEAKRKTVTKSWDESKHPRDPKTKRFIPRGSGEAKTAATNAVKKVLKGDYSVKPQEIADHLSILTVKQIRDLAAEHGRKIPRMLKADLIESVKSLVGKGEAKSEAKPAESKPEGKSEAKPEAPAPQQAAPEPAAKPAGSSEAKPAPKPRAKAEGKSETKPVAKPQAPAQSAPAKPAKMSKVLARVPPAQPKPAGPSKNPRPLSEGAKSAADKVDSLLSGKGMEKLLSLDEGPAGWHLRNNLRPVLEKLPQSDLVAIGDRVGLTGHDKTKPDRLISDISAQILHHRSWNLQEGPASVRPIDGSTMTPDEYGKQLKVINDAIRTKRVSSNTIKESLMHTERLGKPQLLQVMAHVLSPEIADGAKGWSADKIREKIQGTMITRQEMFIRASL